MYIKFSLKKLSYLPSWFSQEANINKLSDKELIGKTLNLSEKINDLIKKMENFATKFDCIFFLSCRFPKPAYIYILNVEAIKKDKLCVCVHLVFFAGANSYRGD